MRSQFRPRRTTQRNRPEAYSLLEVVLASALCASALVPALAVLRDGLTLARNIDTRHQLLLYGVSTMEDQLAALAAEATAGTTWTEGTTNGNFAADGHADIRYIATRSDDPGNADGFPSDELMYVTVTTYRDENGNGSLETGEPSATFTTKIAAVSYAP